MTLSLPSYEEALADPAKARVLFDASKGGNVRGITEDHRCALAVLIHRAQQAAGGRIAAPRDDRYPFRVVINELTKCGWTHTAVYEAPDEETAHESALEYCESIEFSEEGVQAVHYYVGEVA